MQKFWSNFVSLKKIERVLFNSILNRAPLSYANVFLFCSLQLSLWGMMLYGVWQEEAKLIDGQKNAKKSLQRQERLQEGKYFPEYLDSLSWLSWVWQQTPCETKSLKGISQTIKTLELCLVIEGKASHEQWQTTLLQLDEFAPFRTVSMQWVKLHSGDWDGQLNLLPISTDSNRLAYNLFPFSSFSSMTLKSKIQLVGTVAFNQGFSSLLMIDKQTFSVTKGDWLPDILASVAFIDATKIGLRYLDGSEDVVFLNSLHSPKEGMKQ
ncbi:hypothetical protein [Marinomonas sp. 2405UD68-3]|uniref:hypothetical protein n=1 Tax=Marinomonas sp. 2405UD68-3 TaxID=3391835 RepID=UPI0039C9A7F8